MKSSRTMAMFAILAIAAGCQSTKPPAPKPGQRFTGPAFLSGKRRVTAPFASVMFCTRSPAECVGSRNVAAVDPTFGKMADLDDVNSAVNHQIAPRPDPTADDNWTLFPKAGDCEDYAVSKRHVLIRQGWPASSLRLAIGRTERGEGHLVLVARTNDGDVVLDNLTDEVKPWNAVGLRWISIQSSTDPKMWYALM